MYRASSIGSPCLKQLVAARMEYDPLPTPLKIQATFDKGHSTEDRILAQLRKEKPKEWTTTDRQKEVRLEITKNISAVGHIDAVRIPAWRGIEVKSQSDDEYRKGFERSAFYERYRWQLSVYLLALGKPFDVLVVRRDENPEAELEWYVYEVNEPPVSLAEIRARVLKVEALARNDTLPEKCEETVFPCPYFYLHSEIQESDARLLVEKEDLLVLAKQYKADGVKEKQLKERRDRTKNAIDQAIDGDKAAIFTDEGVAKISFFNGSRSYISGDLLKMNGIDPDEKVRIGFPTAAGNWIVVGEALRYKSTTEYRALRVTIPE